MYMCQLETEVFILQSMTLEHKAILRDKLNFSAKPYPYQTRTN